MGSWKVGLYRKIVFRDEDHFRLYVNTQNCRFWRLTRNIAKATNATRKNHSLVRFMGRWHHCTILLQRFCVTVSDERYCEMISNFFCSKCKSMTCMTCSFNKTVPHTCNNGLIERRVNILFRVRDRSIGCLDRAI